MLSIDEKVDFFDLSADVFLYPDEFWFKKLEFLSKMAEISIPNLSLKELQAFHIDTFEINSKAYKTTPIASFWIDGKIMGKTAQEIEGFYRACGFELNFQGSYDHLSNMLAFCAILLENDEIEKLKKFSLWLNWLDKFEQSLQKLEVKAYSQIVQVCLKLLSFDNLSLRERK